MNIVFYFAGAVAIVATFMVITRANAVHALLYLIVAQLSLAFIFYILGAQFAAALEVIIYAGAIMVLFVFVVMMLNLTPQSLQTESRWLSLEAWTGPAILAVVLMGELIYFLSSGSGQAVGNQAVVPQQVGASLFGPYLLGVELSSILLLAGLVGAFHLGRRLAEESDERGGS